jgi:hypothetical protein
MNEFNKYLEKIDNEEHKLKIEEILIWVKKTFPNLKPVIKWNQPMFLNNNTFIIAFSVTKKHISVAPEEASIIKFSKLINESGYKHSKELFLIKYENEIDYSLLSKIIETNIIEKEGYKKFWRV